MRRRLLRIAVVVTILAIPPLALQIPAVRSLVLALIQLMRTQGPTGVLIYTGAYVLGGPLTAPVALFSGIAGFVYGPVVGLLIASPSCLLASVTTFLVGRFALRGVIERRISDDRRLSAILRAVEVEGLRVTLLLRLTPVTPQNFLSYILSATRVRLRDFALGTWLGLLPLTAFQVYLGSVVRDASELLDGQRAAPGPFAIASAVVALVVSATAVLIAARFARRALLRATAPYEDANDAEVSSP